MGVGESHGYGHGDIEPDMFCLYRNRDVPGGLSPSQCPIRVGRVVRVAMEVSDPLVVVDPFWPLMKPHKFGTRVNLYGTWTAGSQPQYVDSNGEPVRKAAKKYACPLCAVLDEVIGPDMVLMLRPQPHARSIIQP